MNLTVVSCDSPLALIQTQKVIKLIKGFEWSNLLIPQQTESTVNDLQKDGETAADSISKIDQALLSDEADIAIFQASDLSYPLEDGLVVLAVVKSDICVDSFLPKSSLEAPLSPQSLLQADGIMTDSQPLQQCLVVVGKVGRSDLLPLFQQVDEREKWGRVDIVGFGAGNYNLLTIKGLELLQKAETIFYDDLIDDAYLSQFSGQKVYVGKRKGNHSFDQSVINELMYQSAIRGQQVVRIKGGDPLLFGRGAEEFHYLQRRLVVAEITPGISSAFAAASQFVIPLTERKLASSVTFLSGHNVDKLVIPKSDTLVFYMGASNQQAIAQKLLGEGFLESTAVAIVKDASFAHSKMVRVTLLELSKKSTALLSPAIIIVGDVAKRITQSKTKWLFTGTQLGDYEGKDIIVHSPLISIVTLEDSGEINRVIADLATFDRIVFTSRYSVIHFFNHLFDSGLDVRALAQLTITSIGNTTAHELKKFGLVVPPLASDESSQAIVKLFAKERISKEKILIPRSNLGSEVVPQGLRGLGNEVVALPVYRNIMPEAVVKHDLSSFEGVIFTSPSTLTNFIRLYGEIPSHLKVVCKGNETLKQLENLKRG